MKYETTVWQDGNNTGFVFHDDFVMSFNAGKRFPVKITVNGFTYRTTMVRYNGQFMVPLNAENRKAAAVKGGDSVQMDIELDDDPRIVEVPNYLEELFKKEGVMEAFRTLSYTNQKEQIRSIEEAKAEDTKQRRIEKSLAFIRKNKKS